MSSPLTALVWMPRTAAGRKHNLTVSFLGEARECHRGVAGREVKMAFRFRCGREGRLQRHGGQQCPTRG
jgi:hypothetical protein